MEFTNIGFMQGRLSPMVDSKIQAFPRDHWREEFRVAEKLGLSVMEWTLDREGLYENPLLTAEGRNEIKALSKKYYIKIDSLTGDCFMQSPFWKADTDTRNDLVKDFRAIVNACVEMGIQYIVIPLVDNGKIEDDIQEQTLFDVVNDMLGYLRGKGVFIVFESDFAANELAEFISKLDEKWFGINYDIGNSAAAGFDPVEEISAYGSRIWNVHVKDRLLNGTTVTLGEGDANFDVVFRALADRNYSGNYILQTARATNGDHAGVLVKYRDMVIEWILNTQG